MTTEAELAMAESGGREYYKPFSAGGYTDYTWLFPTDSGKLLLEMFANIPNLVGVRGGILAKKPTKTELSENTTDEDLDEWGNLVRWTKNFGEENPTLVLRNLYGPGGLYDRMLEQFERSISSSFFILHVRVKT